MISLYLATTFILFYYIYSRINQIYTHWDQKGVPGPKPKFFIGNMLENIKGKKSFGELCVDWSKEFNYAPLIGLYNFTIPFLMVHKVDYIERVMIKDFSHFMDRAPPAPSNVNLSDKFLFIATGNTWKALRTKLSPVFSSGKLKLMTQHMKNCFDNLRHKVNLTYGTEIDKDRAVIVSNRTDISDSTVIGYGKAESSCSSSKSSNYTEIGTNSSQVNLNKKEISVVKTNMNTLVQSYIIDVTAKIVFGIESEQFTNEESEFFKRSSEMFKFNLKRFVCFVLYFIYPKLAGLLRVPFVPSEQTEYFQRIVVDTLNERSKSGVGRNDIIELLLELKEKGSIHIDSWHRDDDYLEISRQNRTTHTVELTEDLISSQAMVFLTTGFDTMSTVLIFALNDMVSNHGVTDKLRLEIDHVVENHGDFTYEALRDMKYLEMCLLESMRLHPPIPAFLRYCTKDFTFPDGTHIEAGTMLGIPVLAVHMDPNVYPEPEEYRPERFATPPPPASYLPFGDGPRICIAKRFAMMQMKMLLARLVHSYEFTRCEGTHQPIETEKWNFLAKPTTQLYFNISPRLSNLMWKSPK